MTATTGNSPQCVSGIYRILNLATGRSYVGSAKNLASRERGHWSDLSLGRHHSSKLQRAWNKYGAAAFSFVVLERCSAAELLAREQHWIDALDSFRSGYNCAPKAASRLGSKASAELRAKLSAAHSGKPLAEHHKAALLEALRRPETRSKTSAALKGRTITAETRQKMSVARLGNQNALGAKRPADVVAAHSVNMMGNQYGKGFKLTPGMLAKRALRRGIPWSASRRSAYERGKGSPWHRYEADKQRWLAEHAAATPEQYTAAMQRLARQAGI